MHDFPTTEEAIAMHDIAVREFGGPAGLRDTGGLDSAIMRPQLGYYNDILEEAAALMESLAMKPSIRGRQQAHCLLHHRHLPTQERSLHRLRQR